MKTKQFKRLDLYQTENNFIILFSLNLCGDFWAGGLSSKAGAFFATASQV